MKLLLQFACVCVLVGSANVYSQSSSPSSWRADFDAAEKEAKATGATLVVHFHASWCGPCKSMERNVLSQQSVKSALKDGIIGVKVDSDFRKDLVRRFGIRTLPTDVFVSADGKVIGRQVGYTGMQSYIASLTRHRTHSTRKPIIDSSQESMIADASRDSLDSSEKKTEPEVRQVNVQPAKLTKALKKESEKRIGLNGYCPVSLAADSSWQSGEKSFVHEFQGVCYMLRSKEELERFKSSPERFVPVLHGMDPVTYKNQRKLETGAIELGARYRNKVFFFATQTNRDAFLRNPRQYAEVVSVSFSQTSSQDVEL